MRDLTLTCEIPAYGCFRNQGRGGIGGAASTQAGLMSDEIVAY